MGVRLRRLVGLCPESSYDGRIPFLGAATGEQDIHQWSMCGKGIVQSVPDPVYSSGRDLYDDRQGHGVRVRSQLRGADQRRPMSRYV